MTSFGKLHEAYIHNEHERTWERSMMAVEGGMHDTKQIQKQTRQSTGSGGG